MTKNEIIQINLTLFQFKNLETFLKRTNLSGEEVSAYIEIIKSMNVALTKFNENMGVTINNESK